MRTKRINQALLATAVVAPIATTTLISCNNQKTNLKGSNYSQPPHKDSASHFLTLNDLHGAAAGYGDTSYPLDISAKNPGVERLANLFTNFKATHPNTMFLSGGDANSGDCFSTATHGETLFPLLKAMDITYSTVGNHAFEWGVDKLSDRVFEKMARTDKTKGNYFITSNILNKRIQHDQPWAYEEGTPEFEADYKLWNANRVEWASPYQIVNLDGKHNICLIGLTTQKTMGDPNPALVRNLSFIDYIASVNYAKRLAKEQLNSDFDKIDAFVLLTHIGSDFADGQVSGEAADVARDINTNVDAIISAHTHKEGVGTVHNDKLGKNIWVGQASTAGRALLDTSLKFDDSKPVGQRLSKVSMEVLHAPIDVGSDPAKPDVKAAEEELHMLRVKALLGGGDTPLYNTVIQYDIQRNKLIKKFSKQAGLGLTTGEKFPAAEHKEILGHQYIWPSDFAEDPTQNYMVEEMGAWISYAIMKGTIELQKAHPDLYPNVVTPSSFIMNFDSITQQFLLKEGEESRPITYGDLFQLQTYENPMYLGYITLGQLCNIIDYSLAGKGTFDYGSKPSYYDNQNTVRDWITDELYEGMEVADSKYVCAPPQLWGFRFETRKDLMKTEDGKIIREYSLDYTEKDGMKIPKLWVYYPVISGVSEGCSMEDPASWISAEELIAKYGKDMTIPFALNSFTFDGGNGQFAMIKGYMQWNEARNPETCKILSFSEFSRDALIKYCESITQPTVVDFTKEWAHKLVLFPEA